MKRDTVTLTVELSVDKMVLTSIDTEIDSSLMDEALTGPIHSERIRTAIMDITRRLPERGQADDAVERLAALINFSHALCLSSILDPDSVVETENSLGQMDADLKQIVENFLRLIL